MAHDGEREVAEAVQQVDGVPGVVQQVGGHARLQLLAGGRRHAQHQAVVADLEAQRRRPAALLEQLAALAGAEAEADMAAQADGGHELDEDRAVEVGLGGRGGGGDGGQRAAQERRPQQRQRRQGELAAAAAAAAPPPLSPTAAEQHPDA